VETRVLNGVPEGAVSVARKNGYIVAFPVARGQVRVIIPVEIPDSDIKGPRTRIIMDGVPEGAVPVAQKNRHIVVIVIRCGHIRVTVMIQVPHGDP